MAQQRECTPATCEYVFNSSTWDERYKAFLRTRFRLNEKQVSAVNKLRLRRVWYALRTQVFTHVLYIRKEGYAEVFEVGEHTYSDIVDGRGRVAQLIELVQQQLGITKRMPRGSRCLPYRKVQ